jgi:hypothetical protein
MMNSEKIYGLIIARIREKVNKAGKFLKILKKLFSKSFFSGVRGKALHLRFKRAASRRPLGRSKSSRKRDDFAPSPLIISDFFQNELIRLIRTDDEAKIIIFSVGFDFNRAALFEDARAFERNFVYCGNRQYLGAAEFVYYKDRIVYLVSNSY